MFIKNKDTNVYCAKSKYLICEIIQKGATIYRLFAPDRHGNLKNVVLSLSNPEDYSHNTIYAGTTLAPCAGRVRHGTLIIDDIHIQLDLNENIHHLHGGTTNASIKDWIVDSVYDTDEGQAIRLFLVLPHGLCGYPGYRQLFVTYLLSDYYLSIHFEAETDRPTWLSMTNHTYWNLSGDFSKSALNHELAISADQVIFNDSSHIPMSVQNVINTPFDFRTSTKISNYFSPLSKHPQLTNAKGYNNAFILKTNMNSKAILYDETSGRKMLLETDSPTLVFYSGGYLNHNTLLDGNIPASDSCALALEAQDFPDSPNFNKANFSILRPGETYSQKIKFVFSCI